MGLVAAVGLAVAPALGMAAAAPAGAIGARYYALGGSLSFLGSPVTDEFSVAGGRQQRFAGGSISWSPPSGAYEVHGAIRDEWSGLHSEDGLLGFPVTDESSTPDGAGRFNHFQGGSVYWTPATGAHEVHGAIRVEWSQLGWETSSLAYPVSDESATASGIGRRNEFAGGSIYWSPGTGAHEVHGAIRQSWTALGRDGGFLGVPTTDESPTPDGVGRYNVFQSGSVYWAPSTGAHEVHGAIRESWGARGWELGQLGYPTSDEYAVPGGRRSDFQHGALVFDAASGRVDLIGAPTTGQVLFDPDIANRGLSAYGQVVNPQDITVMNDPILGAARKVMKMTVGNTDTGGLTGSPRAQVATPEMFAAGSDLYVGWSSMFPDGFPDGNLPNSGWITLSEFYGAPYNGGSPFSIGETGAAGGLSAMTHPPNTSWQTAWQAAPIQHNHWYDFIVHEKLSAGSDGFVEVYTNTGGGWHQDLVNGQARFPMTTMTDANNGGPNYHKLALYYDSSIASQLTVYHTGQKIGTSFAAVAPHSYG